MNTLPIYLFLIYLLSCTTIGQADKNQYIDQYQWKNRLLIIFTSSQSDSTFQKTKQQAMAYQDEIIDRDLLLIFALEKGESRGDSLFLPDSLSIMLRDKYDVSPRKFTVILIGKDGGEKLRQVGRIDFKEIFGRIDAMPMRQSEMRERSQKK
jgi:hypothetical protein